MIRKSRQNRRAPIFLHPGAGTLLGAFSLALAVVSAGAAQDTEEQKPAEETSESSAADQPTETAAPVPSLDELLGLPEAERPAAPEGEALPDVEQALDPDEAELARKLSAEEASEQLRQAIQQMEETSQRLERALDVGLTTQRLQEEILRKLDILIKQAEQQNSSSSSSSSSQQSSSQQQQAPQQGQQQQQQQPSQQQGQQPGSTATGGNPPRQDEEFSGVVDAARAAWGALPDRTRSTLMQGLNDFFSSMYKSETEAYYRRLAEQEGGGS